MQTQSQITESISKTAVTETLPILRNMVEKLRSTLQVHFKPGEEQAILLTVLEIVFTDQLAVFMSGIPHEPREAGIREIFREMENSVREKIEHLSGL